jgi:hypothetical protein
MAIENLSKLLEQFLPENRDKYVDCLMFLQKDQKKWRVRFLISQQINELTQIFTLETIIMYILPISIKLCYDSVHKVRKEASRNLINILKKVQTKESDMWEVYQTMVIETIKGFAV